MPKLHIDLIDKLEEASTTLSQAIDVITDRCGADDELFDRLVAARDATSCAAERLQADADTYGEMAHFGV